MSLALFNDVPTGSIEILFDEHNQPCFKHAHVRKFLNLEDIRTSTRDLLSEDQITCTSLLIGATWCTVPGWSAPKDQQNKTKVFLYLYGVMHDIINSRKEKGKQLRKWVLEDMFPRGLKDKIRELQKDHQLAITERNSKIQAIQYENVVLLFLSW